MLGHFAIASEGNIIFDNFSHKVKLIAKGDVFHIEGTNVQVKLANRIIVKTKKSIKKQQVLGFHHKFTNITELFQGTKSNFFSLALNKNANLTKVIADLQSFQRKHPTSGILLIQPDILQLQSKAELVKEDNDSINALPAKKQVIHSRGNNALYYQSPYLNLLNIPPLWQKTKGKNIKIAIIDDGIFLEHEELMHISPTFSYDIENKVLSSSPKLAIDQHGTKVAGIIFAAHNRIGIDGIAPEAELISLRQPKTWTSSTLLSFQLAKLAGASIINCSWHSQILLQPLAEVIEDLSVNGREGKGIAVVISAGNKGIEVKPNSNESAINSAIIVGANNQHFSRLAYSNYGESVDLFAYGKVVKSTTSTGKYGTFSGTSLAAAIISGLSALLLSEKPELTIEQLTQQLKVMTKTSSKIKQQ
ncbi:hypothetical protein D1094_03500 [Colwellia sp. RSH04]|nr:hypothetical protein D1094_03500 [Colwellia sp. RSH04]